MKRLAGMFVLLLFLGAVSCRLPQDGINVKKDNLIQLNIPTYHLDNESYFSARSQYVPRFSGDLPYTLNNSRQFHIERKLIEGKTIYSIDEQNYFELLDAGMASGLDGAEQSTIFQRWSMDGAFLKHVGTSKEYDVFMIEDADDEDIIVLSNENETLLLAKQTSILYNTIDYHTDLFRTLCFDGKYYANASNFLQIIDAIYSKTEKEARVPKNAILLPMTLTMECQSYYGLSFSVHYYVCGDEQYVYNMYKNSLVKIEPPIPFEDTGDPRILTSITPTYDIGKHYAKWNNTQPSVVGRYVNNWRAEDNCIEIQQRQANQYYMDNECYQRIFLAESNQKGWKTDLAFYQVIGKAGFDEALFVLANTETDSLMFLYSDAMKALIVKQTSESASDNVVPLDSFGICWINNGIIMPANDTAEIFQVLRDKQYETDIPVRYESKVYPGLYFSGWISIEQYNNIISQIDGVSKGL